jgi:hypothetical protein
MEEIGVIAYKSKINPDYQVHIVYNDYAEYDLIKKSLSEMNNSIGALWVGTKNIFIDGEALADNLIDQDQLLAIEAHEIAHSLLGHESGVDEQSEKEADLFAIALLEMDAHIRAASFLKDRMKDLYEIDYAAFEKEYPNLGTEEI